MMSIKLTQQQRKALKFLRDDEEYGDMVHASGADWWLGTHKTSGKLALGLIRLCLVTKEQSVSSNKYERWIINESGRRALDGKSPYSGKDGEYTDDLRGVLGI